MLKISTKLFFILFSFSLFYGCSSTNVELDGLSTQEYKIVRERLDFEKNQNADMQFIIDAKTDESLTMLLDAHVKIMYKINLSKKQKIKSILYVQQLSTSKVYIDKLLLQKKDYFYDSVNHALYLVLNIPYIYLLDNKMQYSISIVMLDKKRKLVTRDILMRYETQAMQENGETYMSFNFEESFDSENVDEYILSMLQSELKQSDLSAFDPQYLKKHPKIFNQE